MHKFHGYIYKCIAPYYGHVIMYLYVQGGKQFAYKIVQAAPTSSESLRETDLMLLHGSGYINSIDSPVVQVCETLDVGQHIAAVVRGSSNGVAGQVDQPQLLELPQVHDIVKGRDVVATCTIIQVAMA